MSIHPFQDGNGRLSRLLTTLLLLQNDYNFIQHVSFENLIEKSKGGYLSERQKEKLIKSIGKGKGTVYITENED